MGFEYVCLDGEGLLRNNNVFYKRRLSDETIDMTSQYYTWGKNK